MKNQARTTLVTMALATLYVASATAQDILKFKDGLQLDVSILEKDDTSVAYKYYYQEGPVHRANVNDLEFIRYKNGTYVGFSDLTTGKDSTRSTCSVIRKEAADMSGLEGLIQEQVEQTSQLISAVQQNGELVKSSVEASGMAQLQQNDELHEKLQAMTDVLTELKEHNKVSKKPEPEENAFTPRVFGFGVYFKTNYLFNEIQMNYGTGVEEAKFLSGTSINLSLNAGMRAKVGFRIEANADFLTRFAEFRVGGDSIYTDLIQPDSTLLTTARFEEFKQNNQVSFYEVGLSPLLVIRRNRVNIYLGFSGSYVHLQGEYKKTFPHNNNREIGENRVMASRSGFSAGFNIGGEYLVTPHIGIRLETGVKLYHIGKVNASENGVSLEGELEGNPLYDNNQNVFGSFARIGGSFYF